MNEQEATNKLEELVGSHEKCFRLMRIYRSAVTATPKPGTWMSRGEEPTTESIFRKWADREGYSAAAIEHYLDHIR